MANRASPKANKESHAAGGCACGAVRYALTRSPLFVHACHCRDCQRESGSAFNHHIMIETEAIAVQSSHLESVKAQSASGRAHYIVRCAVCKSPLWSRHGSMRSKICYVKVGTLDTAASFPPQAHIYVRSKQPWITLDDGVPAFQTYYQRSSIWPPESVQRYAKLRG